MQITIDQVIALQSKWEQMKNADRYNGGGEQMTTFAAFVNTVQPVLAGDGAITVPWLGMWLCIETDGHCHT